MGTAIIVPKEQTQRTTTFLCIYKYLHTFMKKKKTLCNNGKRASRREMSIGTTEQLYMLRIVSLEMFLSHLATFL